MSSDSSLTPRDEQEARLTALLLGELTAEEAEQVRQTLAQDTALAQLHDRLKQTLGLVREAARSAEETATAQPVAPKLSPERRERLLKSFKVVRPEELFRRRQRQRAWRTVAAMAAMIICLLALAGLVWQSGWLKERYMASVSLKVEKDLPDVAGLGADKGIGTRLSREPVLEVFAATAAGEGKARTDEVRRAPQKPPASSLYLPDPSKRELLEESSRGEVRAEKEGMAQTEWFAKFSPAAAPAPAGAASSYGGGISGGSGGGGYGGGGYGNRGGAGGGGGIQAGQPAGSSSGKAPAAAVPTLGDTPALGTLFDTRKLEAKAARPEPEAKPALGWDTAGVAGPASGLAAVAQPQEPANRPTATASKSLKARERFDVLDRKSEVEAWGDFDRDGLLGMRESGRQAEGKERARELAPLPIEFPAASRKNEPQGAVAKTPAPPPPPAAPAATAFHDLNGIELAPLPLKFPAPTLKGTPSELPSGPNIEPLTDKPAATRIVGLPDAAAKPAAPPVATPTPAFGVSQLAGEENKPLDALQGATVNRGRFAVTTRSGREQQIAQSAGGVPALTGAVPSAGSGAISSGGVPVTITTQPATPPVLLGATVNNFSDFSADGGDHFLRGRGNGRTLADGAVTYLNGVEGRKADDWVEWHNSVGTWQLGVPASDRSGPALNLELADKSFFARAGDQPALVGGDVLSESLVKQRGEAVTELRAKLNTAASERDKLALDMVRQRVDSELPKSTPVEVVDAATTKRVPKVEAVGRKLVEIKDTITSAIAGTKAKDAKAEPAEVEKRRLALKRQQAGVAETKPADVGAVGNVYSINAVGYLITNASAGHYSYSISQDRAALRPALETTAGKRVDIALPDGGAEVGQNASFGRFYRANGLEPVRLQDSGLKVASATAALTSEPAKADDTRALQRSTNAPIPQPEVLTRDNAFSTFSLNVSDVSFKLAAASLEKGAMPDVATVRSEEFINAFDYRDPEPTAGTPIAFAWERARYPFAHNRDLLRFSVKTAASGRQAGRPLNLVLLLDNSGSMERADRVRIIQECILVLAGQLQPQDRVSVVTFARTPRLWADGVPGNQAASALERVGTLTPEGGTNLEDALNLAYQTARRHFLAQGVNRVVLLTDGAANLGNVAPDALKQKVESFRQQGLALDCFGIGWEGFNDDLLEMLSRNGDGRYGFVNTPEEAATEFAGQLAGALKVAASDVKVQVEFNPRRVTAYRQIGYAKHQLKKEQFRDNTVDAAEIGAAEAGNALYVVEVDPRGQGPLAIVRVRYKVPGTNDYREHEWPVPFTGVAVPLEQASPALRLAATSSAFSEWLVASPYAGDVAPDRLLNYLRGVPETFGADPRPKKLEWMIRQAKSIAGK